MAFFTSSGKYEWLPGRGFEEKRTFREAWHDDWRDMRMALGGKWEPSSFDLRSVQKSAWRSKAMDRLTGEGAGKTYNIMGDPSRVQSMSIGGLKLNLSQPESQRRKEQIQYGQPKFAGESTLSDEWKKKGWGTGGLFRDRE